MKVTFELPDEKIKFCKLCGRPYDKEEYAKTMKEQKSATADSNGKYFNCSKYCGMFCSWLSDPSMVATLKRCEKDEYMSKKEHHLNNMKNDIAKRVARYLLKEVKNESK